MARATEYLVVRKVATNELSVCRVVVGYKPPNGSDFTAGGPFKSKAAAMKAVAETSEELRKQLYP